MTRILVSSIPKINNIVIKQVGGRDFFISTTDSIIISVSSLAFLLSFLVKNNYMSYKVLEGILEDYHSDKGANLGE